MCDMCRVYIHRDIFCPHRRECKGPDSTELKKGEVQKLCAEIDRRYRATNSSTGCSVGGGEGSSPVVVDRVSRMLQQKQQLQGCEGVEPSVAHGEGRSDAAPAAAPTYRSTTAVSLDTQGKRGEERIRRSVAADFQAKEDEKVRARLAANAEDLLALLE